jgi:hypothetical protein
MTKGILSRRFNVKCEYGKRHFYRVMVFHKTWVMREFASSWSRLYGFDATDYSTCAGACAWTGPMKNAKNCVGIVVMSEEFNKPVTVGSHELMHAAIFYWQHTLKLAMNKLDAYNDPNFASNERFCRISQELHRTFWMGWQRTSKVTR